jgi:hypothetical protein
MGIPPQDLDWENTVRPRSIPNPYPAPKGWAKDEIKRVHEIPGPKRDGQAQYDVVVGIPGETILQRPDVRRALNQAAAQSAQIGVADAEFYPHVSILGTIGLQSAKFATMFNTLSWFGDIGPSITWNILNYGRILSNVRLQDAKFQELVATFQQTALTANQEAEDAMVAYLQTIVQTQDLIASAKAAARTADYFSFQYDQGVKVDYLQLDVALNTKVIQQDAAAQAEGNIGLNLIALYRALGGGWQIRLGARCPDGAGGHGGMPGAVPAEVLPLPKEKNQQPKNDMKKEGPARKNLVPMSVGDGPRLAALPTAKGATLLPPVSAPERRDASSANEELPLGSADPAPQINAVPVTVRPVRRTTGSAGAFTGAPPSSLAP